MGEEDCLEGLLCLPCTCMGCICKTLYDALVGCCLQGLCDCACEMIADSGIFGLCWCLFRYIIPPLGVVCRFGCGKEFLICLILTCLGYFPGLIYAFYIDCHAQKK